MCTVAVLGPANFKEAELNSNWMNKGRAEYGYKKSNMVAVSSKV
jgi:hypothetical protein